jgi:hypothetical protein
MSMLRPFALVLALVLLGGPAVALAQDATPEIEVIAPEGSPEATPVGSGAEPAAAGADDPRVGDTVAYLDETGDEIALVTVVAVEDPFEDFGEYFDVDADSRYVAVEIEVESTGDELDVEPYDFGLQTVDGFYFGTAYVSRDPAAGDDRPELETTEVEEGDSISGLLFYQVPEEAELARLIWQADTGRLLVLADLREA